LARGASSPSLRADYQHTATDEIAAVMGWSYPYTLGVLSRWKMAPVYCRAVLNHPQRIALDGSPAEMVEAKAKDLASKHLARRAASTSARKAAKGAAPTVMKPKPASAPPPAPSPETPKQLRDRAPESVSASASRRGTSRRSSGSSRSATSLT
jgi:sRNA-binding protein